jgi:hypothetical protein
MLSISFVGAKTALNINVMDIVKSKRGKKDKAEENGTTEEVVKTKKVEKSKGKGVNSRLDQPHMSKSIFS